MSQQGALLLALVLFALGRFSRGMRLKREPRVWDESDEDNDIIVENVEDIDYGEIREAEDMIFNSLHIGAVGDQKDEDASRNLEILPISNDLFVAAKAMLDAGGKALEDRNDIENTAVSATPFANCPPFAELEDLASAPLPLKQLGKLAKGGSFFVTQGGRVVIKAVETADAQVLASWVEKGFVETYFGNCDNLASSLLVPIPLSFIGSDKRSFIVMPNVTDIFDKASPEFDVSVSYDIKPLPNLSDGLIKFLKDLMEGWGKDLPKMETWSGWQDVRSLLQRDLGMMQAANIVDFSIFVNVVLRVTPGWGGTPQEFSWERGCIEETTSKTIVCFKLLDYLTLYGKMRQIESQWKGDKFDEYTEKVQHAFDCLGNLKKPGCAAYETLNVVEDAKHCKKHPKLAFMGTHCFSTAYECKVERPTLVAIGEAEMEPATLGIPVGDNDGVDGYFSAYAGYLHWLTTRWARTCTKSAAEQVGPNYKNFLLQHHDTSKHEALRRLIQRLKLAEGRELPKEMPDAFLEACVTGVKDYAQKNRIIRGYSNLSNVLYETQMHSVLVARGNPGTYSHSRDVKDLHSKFCMLQTLFFDCRLKPNTHCDKITYKKSKSHGKVQVLQVIPYRYSDDYAWLPELWKLETNM